MKCLKCKSDRGSGYKLLDSFHLNPETHGESYCSECFAEKWDKGEIEKKMIVSFTTVDKNKCIYKFYCPYCACNVEDLIKKYSQDKWDEEYLKHCKNCQQQAKKIQRNKINSLVQFAREISKKEGRKLKIICDWDETVQCMTSHAVYQFSSKTIPENEFFERYRVKSKKEKEIDQEIISEIEKVRKEKIYRDFIYSPEFYFQSPFLTIADDLLELLKEDLVEKLVFLTGATSEDKSLYEILGLKKEATFQEIKSAYEKLIWKWHPNQWKDKSEKEILKAKEELQSVNESYAVLFDPRKKRLYDKYGWFWTKEEKFRKTFGRFPQTSIKPALWDEEDVATYDYSKWHWAKQNMPDFDLFIDDDPDLMENRKGFYSDDTKHNFLLPDYNYNHHVVGKNVYSVKTGISQLVDEDFAVATSPVAKEVKKIKVELKRKEKVFIITVILLLFISLVLFASLIVVWKKIKQKKNE